MTHGNLLKLGQRLKKKKLFGQAWTEQEEALFNAIVAELRRRRAHKPHVTPVDLPDPQTAADWLGDGIVGCVRVDPRFAADRMRRVASISRQLAAESSESDEASDTAPPHSRTKAPSHLQHKQPCQKGCLQALRSCLGC